MNNIDLPPNSKSKAVTFIESSIIKSTNNKNIVDSKPFILNLTKLISSKDFSYEYLAGILSLYPSYHKANTSENFYISVFEMISDNKSLKKETIFPILSDWLTLFIKEHPKNYRAYLLLLRTQQRLCFFKEALKTSKLALSHCPGNIVLKSAQMDIYMSLTKWIDAIETGKSILQNKPDFFQVSKKLSLCFCKCRDFNQSIFFINKAISAKNSDLDLYKLKSDIIDTIIDQDSFILTKNEFPPELFERSIIPLCKEYFNNKEYSKFLHLAKQISFDPYDTISVKIYHIASINGISDTLFSLSIDLLLRHQDYGLSPSDASTPQKDFSNGSVQTANNLPIVKLFFYSFFDNSKLHDRIVKYFISIQEKLSPYLLLVSGLSFDKHQNILEDILSKGSLDLIKTVFSRYPRHGSNLSFARQYLKENFNSEDLIHRHLNNIFIQDDYILPTTTFSSKSLKIAFCLSGQVRGYKKAFKTLLPLMYENHDFHFYCNFWDNVGRRKLTLSRAHLNRYFNESFAKALLEISSQISNTDVKSALEPIFSLFDKDIKIDIEDVKKTYNPIAINIEPSKEFSDKSNMYCMHYMIEKAYKLIPNPDSYDLIVRLRPDKSIHKSDFQWSSFFEECTNSRLLFSDIKPNIHPIPGLTIGDQLAISTPPIMKIYSHTFSSIQTNSYPYNEYPGYRPMMSIALSLISNSINVLQTAPRIIPGKLMEYSDFDLKTLSKAISECDINSAQKKLLIDSIPNS